MWVQIWAIFHAQLRTVRNRLPRTQWASALFSLFGLVWYAFFAGWGIALARQLPYAPIAALEKWAPAALFGVFLFWQTVPLVTLSTGASLQLTKIQIYPVPLRALFAIEVLLRATGSPEMILLLLGAFAGLLRNPSVSPLPATCLLLYLPMNLFLSLAIREAVLHSFERNRFRELFALLVISIGITPQLLFRSKLGSEAATQFLRIGALSFTPWRAVANATLSFHASDLGICLVWLILSYLLARELFRRSLRYEETTRGSNGHTGQFNFVDRLTRVPGTLLADPLGALVWKELRSLLRMPRFRVVFGMACVFSVLIFIPFTLHSEGLGRSSFVANNFVLIVTLYGLLILSDTLLFNAFGLDGSAAQIYFAAPVSLKPVFWAKNIAALIFVLLQWLLVLAVLALLRMPVSLINAANAIALEIVVLVYFLATGNLSSVRLARAVDPRQTLRKNAGGRMQAWTFCATVGMFVLGGFAYWARWATGRYWASFAVLAVEFAIGCVVYWISLQSAVERALGNREEMTGALSRASATPV